MKRIIYILLTLLCIAGCQRRKEINDKTLAMIFRDAYITNAYLGLCKEELKDEQKEKTAS